MDHRFLRNDDHSLISHLVEECGEVVAAAGKTLRFGLDSVNPYLDAADQETNREWLFREMDDLQQAMIRTRTLLGKGVDS